MLKDEFCTTWGSGCIILRGPKNGSRIRELIIEARGKGSSVDIGQPVMIISVAVLLQHNSSYSICLRSLKYPVLPFWEMRKSPVASSYSKLSSYLCQVDRAGACRFLSFAFLFIRVPPSGIPKFVLLCHFPNWFLPPTMPTNYLRFVPYSLLSIRCSAFTK